MIVAATLYKADISKWLPVGGVRVPSPFAAVMRTVTDKATVVAVNAGSAVIAQKLNALCKENGIALKITGIRGENAEKDKIRLLITVTDIGWMSLVKKYLPLIPTALSANPKWRYLADIAENNPSVLSKCAEALVEGLPTSEKEQLVFGTVKSFEAEICRALTEKLNANGCGGNVTSFDVYVN